MATQGGLAGTVLVQTQSERGLDGHVAASAVDRLAVAPAVMALQQHQLAEEHGTVGVGAALLLMVSRKVGGADEDAAEAFQDIVEGAHRVGLREKAPNLEKRTLLCVDEDHLNPG